MDDLDRQLAEVLGIDVKALEVFEFSNYVESSVENINNNYKKGNKIAYLAILSGIATYKMEKKLELDMIFLKWWMLFIIVLKRTLRADTTKDMLMAYML